MKLLPYYFKWISLIVFFTALVVSLYGAIGSEDFIKGAELVSREPIENTVGPMLPASITHFADIAILFSLLMYVLAKNKNEDEFMQKLRYESAFLVMAFSITILLIVYIINSDFTANLPDLLELQMIAYLIVRFVKRKLIVGVSYEEENMLEKTIE